MCKINVFIVNSKRQFPLLNRAFSKKYSSMKIFLLWLLIGLQSVRAAAAPASGRIASVYISETFINEQIAVHLANSELIKELRAHFDPALNKIIMKGLLQLPLDDHRQLGIHPSMLQFRFQVSIKPSLAQGEYLVLEFPLAETFFYQANSKNPKQDRVVLPTQLLSLGIASMRGYFAALSGDFSSFDRKSAKLSALLRGVKAALATETNEDARAVLVRERKSLELQLAASALEREKFAETAKALSGILGSSEGEKFNLNNEIKARDNAIMLRMKLKNIVPYLKDVELGDIRLGRNSKDGHGESYFILHLHSSLVSVPVVKMKVPYTSKEKFKVPPALGIRLNQAIFSTKLLAEKEKTALPEMVKEFNIAFKEDGIHVTGKVRKFLMNIPFDALVDFVSTGPDKFEVRLRGLKVWMVDLKFLTPFALQMVKSRISNALKGMCKFTYLGKKDKAQAMRVTIKAEKLIPAFPGLHLVDVNVKDENFMLRIGKIQ